jgi:hypothetical protein
MDALVCTVRGANDAAAVGHVFGLTPLLSQLHQVILVKMRGQEGGTWTLDNFEHGLHWGEDVGVCVCLCVCVCV